MVHTGTNLYLTSIKVKIVGQDNSVGIATRYRLDGPKIQSRCRRDISPPYRLALGTIQPPMQWVPGLFMGATLAGAWR